METHVIDPGAEEAVKRYLGSKDVLSPSQQPNPDSAK